MYGRSCGCILAISVFFIVVPPVSTLKFLPQDYSSVSSDDEEVGMPAAHAKAPAETKRYVPPLIQKELENQEIQGATEAEAEEEQESSGVKSSLETVSESFANALLSAGPTTAQLPAEIPEETHQAVSEGDESNESVHNAAEILSESAVTNVAQALAETAEVENRRKEIEVYDLAQQQQEENEAISQLESIVHHLKEVEHSAQEHEIEKPVEEGANPGKRASNTRIPAVLRTRKVHDTLVENGPIEPVAPTNNTAAVSSESFGEHGEEVLDGRVWSSLGLNLTNIHLLQM
eukprot:Lankesteria_metandrocarpae@DN9592_c0_g1_i1.p1